MIPIIAAAFSAVVSAVSSIGPAVAGFCTNVLPKIAPLLETGLEILKVVSKIANIVSQVLGIFKPNESVEDVGDRAIQAAAQGVTPDLYETHADYMEALRDFKLDPDKSLELKEEQKIAAGLAVAGRGLDEKMGTVEGTAGSLFWLAAARPDYFSADKLTQILKTGQDITSIVEYFEGKLGGGESLEVEDKLVELDKGMSPEKDEQSIRAQIYAAADAVQKPQH